MTDAIEALADRFGHICSQALAGELGKLLCKVVGLFAFDVQAHVYAMYSCVRTRDQALSTSVFP